MTMVPVMTGMRMLSVTDPVMLAGMVVSVESSLVVAKPLRRMDRVAQLPGGQMAAGAPLPHRQPSGVGPGVERREGMPLGVHLPSLPDPLLGGAGMGRARCGDGRARRGRRGSARGYGPVLVWRLQGKLPVPSACPGRLSAAHRSRTDHGPHRPRCPLDRRRRGPCGWLVPEPLRGLTGDGAGMLGAKARQLGARHPRLGTQMGCKLLARPDPLWCDSPLHRCGRARLGAGSHRMRSGRVGRAHPNDLPPFHGRTHTFYARRGPMRPADRRDGAWCPSPERLCLVGFDPVGAILAALDLVAVVFDDLGLVVFAVLPAAGQRWLREQACSSTEQQEGGQEHHRSAMRGWKQVLCTHFATLSARLPFPYGFLEPAHSMRWPVNPR